MWYDRISGAPGRSTHFAGSPRFIRYYRKYRSLQICISRKRIGETRSWGEGCYDAERYRIYYSTHPCNFGGETCSLRFYWKHGVWSVDKPCWIGTVGRSFPCGSLYRTNIVLFCARGLHQFTTSCFSEFKMPCSSCSGHGPRYVYKCRNTRKLKNAFRKRD